MTAGGDLLTFVGLSVAVIVVPGPSILLIVADSLQQGLRAGLYAVCGISAAMAVQLAIVLAGLTSVLAAAEGALIFVRWFGIAYLFYLGVQRWRSAEAGGLTRKSKERAYRSAFIEGAIVALTNPTTLLFFVAFLPQFVTDTLHPLPELLRLALIFWTIALICDIGYALLAARIGTGLQQHRWMQLRDRLGGAIMLAAALILLSDAAGTAFGLVS